MHGFSNIIISYTTIDQPSWLIRLTGLDSARIHQCMLARLCEARAAREAKIVICPSFSASTVCPALIFWKKVDKEQDEVAMTISLRRMKQCDEVDSRELGFQPLSHI